MSIPLIAQGELGTASWSLDEKGILRIGAGTFFSQPTSNYSPWSDWREEIKVIDGTAPFIALGDFHHFFADLPCVTSIDLSGWNTLGITNMNWMFEKCNQRDILPRLKRRGLPFAWLRTVGSRSSSPLTTA